MLNLLRNLFLFNQDRHKKATFHATKPEMDRKDKIRQQLGIAVAVFALLGNIASYFFLILSLVLLYTRIFGFMFLSL